MAVRRETIILELEDNVSAKALGAAAALKTLDASLNGIGGNATTVNRRFASMTQRADKLSAAMTKTNAALGKTDANLASMGSHGLVRFSSGADQATASIDKFSGRLGLLGAGIMAIGPAAIPITAAAIPAISGLAAGMGAAAGAAGVLMLAFNGVGDAVSAVSDYRLAPTAENLAKVREEMDRLGPAGASFVMAIDEATPALEDLQRTAREGMFPGFERGLDELMTQLPAVRDLVSDLSVTVGSLGEASVNALTNDADWQEFFAHIGTDGASAMDTFGRATGNFVAGVANVLEALTGISGGGSGLADTARSFREWAAELEHTEGFKEFADYVRQSGPQVAEFLGATGNAMLGLVEAAAPWGQVVLPALTALADVTAALAGSPLGPPLFAAAAAMLAFNKASALMAPNLDRAKSSIGGFGTTLRQTGADLMTMAGGWSSASKATGRDAAAMTAATGRLKGNLASVGQQAKAAGPGIAAFGFMASGAAEKMGLSNTALLGMAGSVAGPWGAAIGAGVGLAMDFAAANDSVEEAVSGAQSAIAGADFSTIGSQMKTASAAMKDFKADVASVSDGDIDWDFGAYMKGTKNWVEGIFGKSDVEELQERLNKTRTSFSNLVDAGAKVGEAFDIDVGGTKAQKLQALQELATQAGPAMSALGISWEQLADAAGRGDGSLGELVGRMQEWQATADSTAGRTAAVGDAIAALGADAISTAASADALSAALSGAIGPGQSLVAAQDAMSSTLNGLNGKINATNKSLIGTSDAAIQNRAAISGGVTAIQNLSAAQAAAGASSLTVAHSMSQQREALIGAGVAAGLSRGQVERLINQMGLTPDVVRTAFEAAGIEGVDAKTQRLTHRFNALPKKLRTDIATNGIPKSEADISRLQKKYGLTPRQVRTLAALMDNASGPIAAVIAALNAADGKTATTYINTVYTTTEIHRKASYGAAKMKSIAQADGGFWNGGIRAFADGGFGMDGRYYTREPQIIPGGANILWGEKETGWEAYISGKPSERERNLEVLAMAADRLGVGLTEFANGGITAYAKGGSRGRGRSTGPRSEKGWDRLEKSLDRHGKRLEKSLKSAEKAVDRAKDGLDKINQKRNELKSQVSGSLKKDWFNGGSGNAFSATAAEGSAAFAQQQWRQQVKDSKQLSATIANLRKNGAGDRFIAEILNSEDPLSAARMFNKQSKSGMRASQSLFLQASYATNAAANSTSSIYADEQRRATAQLRSANSRLSDIKKAINTNHKQAERTRKAHSSAKAAAKGRRNKR